VVLLIVGADAFGQLPFTYVVVNKVMNKSDEFVAGRYVCTAGGKTTEVWMRWTSFEKVDVRIGATGDWRTAGPLSKQKFQITSDITIQTADASASRLYWDLFYSTALGKARGAASITNFLVTCP
jgi:hypothetical protein